MEAMAPNSGRKGATIEIVKPDQPPATPPPDTSAAGGSPFGRTAAGGEPQPDKIDPNELKPNVPPDANELKPTDSADQTLPPPVQVNEIQQGQAQGQASKGQSSSSTASADNTPASDQELSSSKKKKKTGLKKIIPF